MIVRSLVCVSASMLALLACGGADGPQVTSDPSPGPSPATDGGAGGGDAADGTAATPFTCDADPALDARVVDETCGVFVAPPWLGGEDARPGTRAQPIATVSHGLDVAQQLGRRWVFVCASEFTENVVMRPEHAGVRVYGALGCPDEASRRFQFVGSTPSM